MLVTFLLALFSLVVSYLSMAGIFVAARAFKIMGLYEEHMMTRSREHKSHTKLLAVQLKSEVQHDLLWPVILFRKASATYTWLKS